MPKLRYVFEKCKNHRAMIQGGSPPKARYHTALLESTRDLRQDEGLLQRHIFFRKEKAKFPPKIEKNSDILT